MNGVIGLTIWLVSGAAPVAASDDPPIVIVDRDDVVIEESCRLRITEPVIEDVNGDGVIHIRGDGIVVDFADQTLRGASIDAAPDAYAGIGAHVSGDRVTIRGGTWSGFKVAILATDADDLTIEDVVLDDNFRQRLRSTPQAEDSSDWLWPHHNDDNEWLDRYGAGLYLERSDRATVRRIHARRGQNGIILDESDHAVIYDNDCSFLSGWGLALWRSGDSLISRNAFDFCVRGYSHGVYNRGQDSAGILLFEQCSRNIIAENSVTHGGDGFFGFAGSEALGEKNPRADLDWYRKRGNNDNLLINNDFSDAVAHGVEITFSFGNQIIGNRMARDAICGVWGGYSQETRIENNDFQACGDMAYGLERGGVNIEHGSRNIIAGNSFTDNACGVHLWWDSDEALLSRPWARINGGAVQDNRIVDNVFSRETVAVHLRDTEGTTHIAGGVYHETGQAVRAEGNSPVVESDHVPERPALRPFEPIGEMRPVGARDHLAGRKHIVMTEWGPYDWQQPRLQLVERRGDHHVYRVLGVDRPLDPDAIEILEPLAVEVAGTEIVVRSHLPDRGFTPYQLTVVVGREKLTVSDVLQDVLWDITFFASPLDPRTPEGTADADHAERWRAQAELGGVRMQLPAVDFPFRGDGPSQLQSAGESLRAADIPRDGFGVIASTRASLPAGRWEITTTSDDGIRVWLDEELVIDDWTWHATRRHDHIFTLMEARDVHVRIEYFELVGAGELTARIRQAIH